MKFFNDFEKMKSEYKSAEKDNSLRSQEHSRTFEQLKRESEEQKLRVKQQLKYFYPRNK